VIQALTSTRPEGPRHHFRGKKRYFRRVQKDAASFRLEHGPGSWWDCWHYHADWPGWGNLSWRYRLEHIRALTQVFRGIADDANQFSTPFQTWIYLSGRDAGEDATYVHTPNGNQTQFPMEPLGIIDWEHRALLSLFNQLLPNLSLRIGESRIFDEWAEPPRVVSSFFIYSPDLGVPLETTARLPT
jgi:hypothetical protein